MANELAPDPSAERAQLLRIVFGTALVGALFYAFLGPSVPVYVLAAIGGFALAGRVAFRWIGRDVFLILSVAAMGFGHVASWLVMRVMYALAIVVPGALLRLFGVNRLDRDFEKCRAKETMFHPAPASDADSFVRQS